MAKNDSSSGIGCLIVVVLVLAVGWASQNPGQAVAIAAVLITGVGGLWWWRRDRTRERTAAVLRAAAAVPGAFVPQEGLVTLEATTFVETRGDAAIDVVGEQYYPAGMAAFKRQIGAGFGKAVIARDPLNQFDPNAVAVYAEVDEGAGMSPVGHLAREDAAAYVPVFEFTGTVIQCQAAVARGRGGAGTDGVVLHLGTPGELIAEAWHDKHPALATHPWRDKVVAFSGFGLSLSGVTLDAQGQALLARLSGCLPARSVTKKVDVCVATNPNEATSNLLKARDYGIPIVKEREFWIALGVDPAALGDGLARWAQPQRRAWTR